MSSRAVLNVVMLVAAAATALMVYTHAPEKQIAESAQALVPIAQEDIRAIEITRVNSARVKLQRNDKDWNMLLPVRARLDETALARVLDLSRIRPSNALAATDLASYGLDKPWATVRFENHLLEFGSTNTVTEEVYVRSGDVVYAVPARTATSVPATPGRLIAHRMFAPDEIPVAVSFKRFTIKHDGMRWQLVPSHTDISQDDLIRWVEQWRYATSTVTQPGTAVDTTDVVVELRDGRSIEFTVKARQPDLVLHRRNEGLDYHFNAGMAAMLLEAPSTAESVKR
jgi:hypothetical protein